MKHIIQYKDKNSVSGWQEDTTFGKRSVFYDVNAANLEMKIRAKFSRSYDFRVIVEEDDVTDLFSSEAY